jgi:hypothetical protein
VDGGMAERLDVVHGEYNNNFVRRLAGLAYLMYPLHDVRALKSLIRNNIYIPFGILAWRLQSDHDLLSFLLGVRGIRTGANLYNGTHMDWAQDATRDVYQTRVVITTDAHVFRPENLRILPDIMPRAYLGGHNAKVIKDPQELLAKIDPLRRASVIVTIASLGDFVSIEAPLSFDNSAPAMIARGGNDVRDPSPDQYFAGGGYYAQNIYKDVFGRKSANDAARALVATETLYYKADPTVNTLAFEGYNLRWDYKQEHYCKPVRGNGHRADVRLNQPGARPYLNGETAIVPPERPATEWLLA